MIEYICPFNFYIDYARKIGINKKDLINNIIITSIKDPQQELENGLGEIKIFYYYRPQILFYSTENGYKQVMIAGSQFILNSAACQDIKEICNIGKLLNEEYYFALSGNGFCNISVRNNKITRSQTFINECKKEFFEIGKNYQCALENMLDIYSKKS